MSTIDPKEKKKPVINTETVIPPDVAADKKMFQKWFLNTYIQRFNEMPELALPNYSIMKKERLDNREKYFMKVCHTVSMCMFGRDETSRLLDKSRVRDLVSMRKMICFILVKKLGYSLTLVGRMMGKNHATVLYHCNCAEDHIKYDKNFNRLFVEIHQNLSKQGVIW